MIRVRKLEEPAHKKGSQTTMHIDRILFGVAHRAAVIGFLFSAATLAVQAQQAPSFATTAKAPVLMASESDSAGLAAVTSSSSSSSSDAEAGTDTNLSSAALESSQPPARRYGHPNYAGSNSNPDGSNKYTFAAGVGLATTVGNTHKYETPSYSYQFGGGRNFSKSVGLLLQFDYDHFGMQGATLGNQTYIYNFCTIAESNLPPTNPSYCFPEGPASASNTVPIDGNNHVWSFTLNPTFTLPTEGKLGAYAVVGGGFYHKVTNFTFPGSACADVYCDFVYSVNQKLDQYTSNSVGVNGGFGLTYKFSHFSNERFYVEARYVYTPNSQRSGYTSANIATAPLNATNFYPANSNRTTYIPVKFGIRF
jgi:hypothetical protein